MRGALPLPVREVLAEPRQKEARGFQVFSGTMGLRSTGETLGALGAPPFMFQD